MKYLPRAFEELSGLRCRGLVRESTVEQGEHGSGPAEQRDAEIAFAAKWNLTFDGRFYEDFKSGSSAEKRPQFLQMIADAKAGQFECLLCYDTTRFGRNWREVGRFEAELHAAGVVVVYVQNNALSSGTSQISQVVHHALGEEWLDVHRQKVRAGYRRNRFEKGKVSGTAPLGYRMGYQAVFNPAKGMAEPVETGILEPDVEPQPRIGFSETYTRADLVRIIGDLYAAGGIGVRPLAAHLNQQGYRTAKGAPLSGGAIRTVVENPVYAGWIAWHERTWRRLHGEVEERVRGPHQPLWSDAQWEQIQAVRRRQSTGSNGGKVTNTYPFRRLAVCDRCGHRMYGEPHSSALYMACGTQRERHDCAQQAVRSAHLEDQVGEWLETLVIPEDWRADIERMQRGIARAVEERPPIDLTRIGHQLDNLKELFVLGDITREEYVGRSRALKASLEGGRPQPTYSEAVLVRAARLLAELGDLWKGATPQERQEIAGNLFAEVRVRDDRIVSSRLAQNEYLLLVASATARDQVGVARPEGSEPPTI